MGSIAGNRVSCCLVFLLLLLLLPHPAAAGDDTGEATGDAAVEAAGEPAIEEEALEILRPAIAFLPKAQRFSFRATTTFDRVQESGQKLQFGSTAEIKVRRPDRVSVSAMRDDGTRRRVWYKKGHLAIYEDGENVYGTLNTPDNIDDTLDYVEEKGFVRVPVSDLLYSDLSYLETRAESGILVGESRVEGVVCNHLAFRNEVVDWQLWIEKGSKPLFRKFLITYNEQPGQPQFAAFLDRWNFSPTLPDSLFLFSPPEGAEKIRFLSMQARPPDEEESGQSRTPSSEGEDTE